MKSTASSRVCVLCGGPVGHRNVSDVCTQTLECKRENRRRHRIRNFATEDAARRKIYQTVEGRAKSMLASAKQRSQRDGVPFGITLEDLLPFPDKCPVFGVEFDFVTPRSSSTPQLDRLVPCLGYVPGNLTVISTRANRLKSDASPEELRRIADWMEERGYND